MNYFVNYVENTTAESRAMCESETRFPRWLDVFTWQWIVSKKESA